jgi:hypothetical protein
LVYEILLSLSQGGGVMVVVIVYEGLEVSNFNIFMDVVRVYALDQ